MAKIYVMIGIPGCGKSTIAEKIALLENATIISSDEIRGRIFNDENYQGNNSLVFQIFYSEAKSLLAQNKNIILDATNISKKSRRTIFNEFSNTENEIIAIYVNTDLSLCLQQNQNRDRVVPTQVIRRMFNNLEEPTEDEGFTEIIKIHRKKY